MAYDWHLAQVIKYLAWDSPSNVILAKTKSQIWNDSVFLHMARKLLSTFVLRYNPQAADELSSHQ